MSNQHEFRLGDKALSATRMTAEEEFVAALDATLDQYVAMVSTDYSVPLNVDDGVELNHFLTKELQANPQSHYLIAQVLTAMTRRYFVAKVADDG